MADQDSAVKATAPFRYTLEVPTSTNHSSGGEARYLCCHQTVEQGHAENCTPVLRDDAIRSALTRAGFVAEQESALKSAVMTVEQAGVVIAEIPFAPSRGGLVVHSNFDAELDFELGVCAIPLAKDSPVRVTAFEQIADENMRVTPEFAAKSGLADNEDSGEEESEGPRFRYEHLADAMEKSHGRDDRSDSWDEGRQSAMLEHCGRISQELVCGNPVTLVAHGRTLGTFLPDPLHPLGFEFRAWPLPIMGPDGVVS